MLKTRWLLALPLALAATVGQARASSIRDNAGLFDPDAVRQAQQILDRTESRAKLTTIIETVDSLDGQGIEEASLRHAQRSGIRDGVFILIAKKEHKIDVRASKSLRGAFPPSRDRAIRDAFVREFKNDDFNAGLIDGVKKLEEETNLALAENGGVLRRQAPAAGRGGVPVPRGRPQQSFGLGSLLGIGLAIIAVLFVIRLISGAFSGGYGGYGGPGRTGGPGYGAQGFGGPAYGGRGGGFWSSMFGGIGGALAGNWLYDQFSGRHHGSGGYMDTTSYGDGNQGVADTGGDDWSGGTSASGDWGGGDGGGGGDWGGGGGGDWGGGGGGGGGDW